MQFVLLHHGSDRFGGGQLHLVRDRDSPAVQYTPEQAGKTEDVIDLIGVIGPPGSHDANEPLRLFRINFRYGIGQGEYNGVVPHVSDIFGL
ncbi:hypothetical protein D1872_319490 [compost metagenome]